VRFANNESIVVETECRDGKEQGRECGSGKRERAIVAGINVEV